jgi:hypothetical protein
MRCDQARPLISADLDGEASAAESAAAAEHLAGCAECQAWQADALRLDAAFAAPVDVVPLDAATVGGLTAAAATPAAAAAAAVPPPRSGGSRNLMLAGAVLAAALITGTAFGLMSGDGGGDGDPIALPTVSTSLSPSPDPTISASTSTSASTSQSPSASPTISTSPVGSASASTTGSPTTSASASVTPTGSTAPQPLVATARAGVLDAELRIDDARPKGRITGTFRVTNNTRSAVSYHSPECYELRILVNGNQVSPPPPPCTSAAPVQHTLEPGESHELAVNLPAPTGEHKVTAEFRGRDVEPSPDPGGGKPTPSSGPSRVRDCDLGPITVRVR